MNSKPDAPVFLSGALVARIRRFSNHLTTPAGACPTDHAFYDSLKKLEHDLHQQIHLENDILFSRAILLESSAIGAIARGKTRDAISSFDAVD
jgi:hypothetical protein